ncbi:phosphodiester glycosidase family protein [Tamaricihabitans halophyticus]|uniref:phosphodiester glycosidase family protein n=1 Tax=Tamaricihabitans halophyticus TaxID=1262583 RepID=UPI001FB33E0B|nr:phosphodiester glycosidase family protein [Tamaricihabitans halophyticus]
MPTSTTLLRATGAPVAALLLGSLLTPAAAATQPANAVEEIAPGVSYERMELSTDNGSVVAHVLTAELGQSGVALDLLYPGEIAAGEAVSAMADSAGAVGGVNADFFNITQEHDPAPATSAPVGPVIANGNQLKAAVPDGQRFGPGLAEGTSTKDVFAVGADGAARVDTLTLAGSVQGDKGNFDLAGLNQYAIAVDGIGAFTSDWGTASRMRATCGTDTDRQAPCSSETAEVTITGGEVTDTADEPGSGDIAEDSVVLVGREQGAAELGELAVGDKVTVDYQLESADGTDLDFAVGGAPILRDGSALPDLDTGTLAPRTSAGVSADGKTVYLATVDGRSGSSVGMSIAELADLQVDLGAAAAVNLDGGGSSTLVARESGADKVTVRNDPSDGAERSVANGIGIRVGG